MANTNAPYPQGDDPFFWLPDDSEWNACIGRQGTEENYVDGYIEAAIELASAVIEKRMYGKRDTLVMPILYNARHALELSLKFAINRLYERNIIKHAHPKNHDIMSHWALLHGSAVGDEEVRECVAALNPYVSSLSQIDDDGQELRYSENRDGQKSLADHSLANIEIIRTSLNRLGEVMERMKHRVLDLVYERATGSFTARCSRRDLLEIAGMLPKRNEWRAPAFVEAKANVTKRFGLSGGEFSKAVKVIEGNREMRCLVGLETSLVHLRDQNALFAVEQWARCHPVRPVRSGLGIDYISERNWDVIREDRQTAHDVNNKILEVLTPDEIADMEAIFYIGRDGEFCEYYERNLELTKEEHRLAKDLAVEVNHLMQKANFQEALASGVSKLGRPDLADMLLKIRPGAAPA